MTDTFDVSDLDALAREFADSDARLQREVPRIMRKAGVNIRDEWRAAYSASKHFRGKANQAAAAVNFDERLHFGAMHEIEVGPDRRRRRIARLAGIAHFGGANGGGGTLGDPQRFADKEAPRMAEALAEAAAKAVLGR